MKQPLRILSFGSMGLIVAALIAATIIGNLWGSSYATEHIYHSWWFITLWALFAVTAMTYILCSSKRTTLALLHASFVVIQLGALVSFLTSKRGDIAIAQEGAPASMFEMSDGTLQRLPFRMQLVDVDTVYADSGTPSDYKAHILALLERERGNADGIKECAEHTVSLNSPMKINGYQFCIKAVSNGNLSLLVSHDPAGRTISYVGYAMVFISFLLLFFDKKSGFNTLLLNLKDWRLPKNPAKKKGSDASLSHLVAKLLGLLLCILVLLCLLWYRRDVFPATNGAEALMLLAVFVALLAVALRSKKEFALLWRVLVVAAAGIAVTAGVCGFDGNGDVQPILRTPLLGIHVTTIIIAYALLACTAINAVIALCTKDEKRRSQQALLGRLLLYPATMLLACGIFIGAVWANLSWGRYWGWDPKEVWALITLLVCSVGFHSHSLPFIANTKAFHIFCIIAFAAVLFTFFGVNYLLGGLHSYM